MAITPEKNDIDISKLFNWGRQFSLRDSNGEEIISLYIKIISDEDLNRAKVHSLRKSAELRRKLKNKDSDERLAYIVEKDILSIDDLVDMILSIEASDIATDILSNTDFKFPKELTSKSTLEDQENYQLVLDNWEKERNLEISKKTLEELTTRRDRYLSLNIDELYRMYENTIINKHCEEEVMNSYKNFCLYCACYKDENYTERFFNSSVDMYNLPKELKDQILNAYNSLDITIEDLKK